jgi:glutathione S-transferase
MILVGQYDSPFVRRIAIALHHYEKPFERKILSTFKDFEEMLRIHPLGTVPSLILDDGEVLFDSRAIIDYLDGIALPERALAPTQEPDRRTVLRIEAIGIGVAEKLHARALEYSRRAPGTSDPNWRQRLDQQIASGLDWLERLGSNPWLFGDRFTRADLAVAIAVQYLMRVVPHLYDERRHQGLSRHRGTCEALPCFAVVLDAKHEAIASGWSPAAASAQGGTTAP